MQRRVFLQETAAAMGMLAGRPQSAGAFQGQIPPGDNYRAPDWLRYSRSVYFEGYAPPIFPHPKNFNAKTVIERCVELGADTLRFQPVGYRAAFPSRVYPVDPELNNRDLIDEVSRECRAARMHLYCYCVLANEMDAGLVDDPKYGVYALRDVNGRPYGFDSGYGNGMVIKTCSTGDPYRQMIRKLVRELCDHDIDGVYFDAPSGYRAICFCQSCSAGFRKFSGMELQRLRGVNILERVPEGADMKALGAWYDWANKLTEEDLVDLRNIIHGSGKFMLCHNGATWRPGSFHAQYRYSDGFMVEYSEQFYQRLVHAMMGASMARPGKKLTQAYMGSYDVASIGQPAHNRPWTPHCMNLEDGDEILMEGFTDLAGGSMPLYAVVNRLLYGVGDGSIEPAKEVFSLVRRAQPVLKDSVPVPYVTIVPTAESLELFRTRRRSWNVMMSESFALVMLDERIGFDVVPNLELTSESLKGHRVIALCGASAVTDEDALLLTDWVRGGGALLATYDSGLYDGKGEVRRDGGALRDVLGVEMQGEPPDGRTDAFYRIVETHPALGQYHAGRMVMGDARLVPVRTRPGATILAQYVNLETDETLGPAIVVNEYGQGRAIYVGGSLEAQYTATRVLSLQRILGSVVSYLAGNAPVPFLLEAPKGIYGILRRTSGGDLALWICANVGFKDAAVGRMRQDFISVPNVVAKIRMPDGRQVKAVELLRAGRAAAFTVNGGYVEIAMPPVHVAEIVHVSLA